MTNLAEEDAPFTELVDATFPRVDLVGKGANGVPRFLIAKQDASAGLLPPEFVRDLIAKGEPESGRERVAMPNGLTISGSPGAIAELIHKAALASRERDGEDVAKAKYDTADRKRMAGKQAMEDGSYPIADEADLDNAIHAVGRGGASHDAIRKHIISRAKSLGASSKIPDNWNSDGSLKESVSKEDAVAGVAKDMMSAAGDAVDLDDGIDGMDPTVPLAAPDEMAPGDPTDPGSPAWESIDAATASKWLGILARAKNALCMLAEREMLEAASADPDDAMHAMDLEDACCAIDYAIGQLAVFAADECAEAELGAEAMEAIGKAAAGAEAPLGVVEPLAAVRKAGRVLSAANEAAIRAAAESLQKVLASLPEAPIAKQKEGAVHGTQTAGAAPAQVVAKEGASPEEQARDTGPVQAGGTTGLGQPRETGPADALPADGPQKTRPGDVPGRQVVKSALALVYDRERNLVGVTDAAAIVQRVAKADGDGEKKAMQAVFDQDGDLIGIVDPDAIQPVTGAGGKPAADDGDGDGDGEPQAGPAAAADDGDMTPQPPADAGTPADDVAKTAGDSTDAVTLNDVLKSITDQQAAFSAQQAALLEAVAKTLATGSEAQAEEIRALKARMAVVEEQPAAPKVFANGAVPPAHMLRGQDQGGTQPVDVAKAAALKETLYRGTAPEQNAAFGEMQRMAVEQLAALQRR